MGWSKQFAHCKPYKKVKCINPSGCKMIYQVSYGVINETPTKYHIQFDSGGTKWYSKDRFIDWHQTPPKPKKIKVVNKERYSTEDSIEITL